MSSTFLMSGRAEVLPQPTLPEAIRVKESKRGRPPRPPVQPASREAQRFAAAILEVLAGVRTPPDAAAAMSVSLPRYYLWEQRALAGLVAACEPRPVGKHPSAQQRIASLEKDLARLRQHCARQQALVRAAQRTIGLGPPSAARPAAKANGKATASPAQTKRKRRPMVRALKAAAALRAASAAMGGGADSPSAASAEVLQRNADGRLPSPVGAVQAAPAVSAP